jgi:D-aminoacyl-tRNA deacylase
MILLIQRVLEASCTVDNSVTGSIQEGLLVLFCAENGDTERACTYLADKTAGLRIFNDGEGKMNRSVLDVGGGILAISQFTLAATLEKGMRPSYSGAAKGEDGLPLYTMYCDYLREKYDLHVAKGIFGSHMRIASVNDGPVTIWLRKEF